MKNRSLVALLLAGALAIPAFAQTTTTSQDQSATPSAAPAPTKADAATGKDPLQPDTHEGFWGKMNPFARKKYVQRQTAPIRDRVNELDELTSQNTKLIKDVDSRPAGHPARFQQGEWAAGAIDAGNRASAAQQTATGHHPLRHRRGSWQYRSVPRPDRVLSARTMVRAPPRTLWRRPRR
jgi:hypothetical protein